MSDEPDSAPLVEPGATNVHWFESQGGWWVVAGDASTRFEDRTSAFAAARDLARQRMPSRLVPEEPDAWNVVPTSSPPVVDRDDGPKGGRTDWPRLAGPERLGRSVLVTEGSVVPSPWDACERVSVTMATLGEQKFLEQVRRAYLVRTRVVYVLSSDVIAPADEIYGGDVWGVPVDHDFVREATWELLTSNAVDARAGAPWPWSRRAIELGASSCDSADVMLPDGRPAWCDGGPLRLWAREDLTGDDVVVPREAVLSGRLVPVVDRRPEADLADDQLAAVAEPDVRARIIAPAGSGKTRVLTERARHLLGSAVPGSALTLVAFNKRAQLEMVERTPDLPGLQVRTLNALALAILNGASGFEPRRARVTTIDEVQVRDLLAELVRFPRRANTDPAAPWIEALSRIRLGLQDPAVVEGAFDGDVEGLARIFPAYRGELARRGVVDFDEQIYLCLEALLGDPAVRHAAQRQCQLLLVDEFQDLTPAHMLLLRLLAGPTLSIFGVGDDDQTIYGYSGATTRWLVRFEDFVPAPTYHALDVNYRCPERVVAAATNLLSRNRQRVEKTIRAGPRSNASMDALQVVEAEHPEAATTEIVRRHLGQGARPDEIAVLARVNSALVPIQAALLGEGIPVHVRDGGDFLGRTGVAAALAWVRLAVTAEGFSRADLMASARRPSRGISPKVVEWIGEQSDVRAVERLADRITDARTADKVRSLAGDLERIREFARTANSAALVEYTRSETGLERAVETLDEAHIGRNRQAHSDDLRALTALGRLHPDPRTFSSWLRQTLVATNAPEGVTLATVHRVKGLEWPHVIVHDATGGLFPHRLSTDVEEERRVFHVAITRAKATLHVVADVASPTLFLGELDAPAAPGAEQAPRSAEPDEQQAVVARVGLDFVWGGYRSTVVAVEAQHVVASIGSTHMNIPFGSDVTVEGRLGRLAPPGRTTASRSRGTSGPADPAVFDSLKAWRRERSSRDKVPAYVVAADKTLESIAAAMPTDEASLLAVHGIGATKVELYGAEILGVVDTHRPAG